jgi:hypothetical protein
MHAICPANLIDLGYNLVMLAKGASYEAPHCAVSRYNMEQIFYTAAVAISFSGRSLCCEDNGFQLTLKLLRRNWVKCNRAKGADFIVVLNFHIRSYFILFIQIKFVSKY